MAIQYSTTHRTNAMTDIATQAGTNANIKIFTGSPPANCATADTGTVLVTLTGNASGLGTATSGVLTFNAITSGTASNTGTAGYFRVYPSSATTTNAVLQGTVGTSGTDMIIGSTSISSGQTVSISSWTITAFGA
jgi:hypothetical protein